jgi:hypothetical protein
MTLTSVAKMYDKLTKYPFGKAIFSNLFCIKAPYFMSISPMVNDLKSGYGTKFKLYRYKNEFKNIYFYL